MGKRILICSDLPLLKSLGGAKVVVEAAEGLRANGWHCDLAGTEEIEVQLDGLSGMQRWHTFAHALRRFLQQHAAKYDVVDYGHEYLPFPRSDFPQQTLFVARSVLLAHHFETISIPTLGGWRATLSQVAKGSARRNYIRSIVKQATLTTQQADCVNVSNDDDKHELQQRGIDAEKIIVLPFGISRARRPLFDAISSAVPPQPKVAFVGTFDARKGAREFPDLVAQVCAVVPQAKFKLLGTAGLFPDIASVLKQFPSTLHSHLEVLPRYEPEQLPTLLADCCVGVFPSHVEGFGFGVLEMLASSIPVIAYDVPGPRMMLPPNYLVPRRNVTAMATAVTALLGNETILQEERLWAKQQSKQFDWNNIGAATGRIYAERWQTRQIINTN